MPIVSSSGCATTIVTSAPARSLTPADLSRAAKAASEGESGIGACSIASGRGQLQPLDLPRGDGAAWRIASDHGVAELRELLRNQRGAGMVRHDPAVLRREAECYRHFEIGERFHLSVEPIERARPEAVRPGQPCTERDDA